MTKPFFASLIKIESIIISLNELGLTREEKVHLAHLVDSSLHNKILDTILSQLNEQDKKQFLVHLKESSHDKIWNFLNEKIEKIEDKIKNVAKDLQFELEKDIKKAKDIKE